jgi:hypothetical protein
MPELWRQVPYAAKLMILFVHLLWDMLTMNTVHGKHHNHAGDCSLGTLFPSLVYDACLVRYCNAFKGFTLPKHC